MGIQGLLQALKPLIQATNISCLKGKKVAIDGYCWLHKAVYGCAVELCLQQESDSWIKYCMSFLDLLIFNDIQVVLVFDGADLPAKGKTESERSENRQKNFQLGKDSFDKKDFKMARNYFARAVNITPKMAAEFVQFVKLKYGDTVTCIVAPYEADAQLAYLSKHGLVDAVVSEDSDCIAYGCSDIIFKLNRDGSCDRLILSDIYSKCIDTKFDLRNFSPSMFLEMCIIAGCDYLASLPGIGLKTSYKLMAKHRDGTGVLKALRLEGVIPLVPTSEGTFGVLDYELKYYEAWCTFHHQIVYDPRSKQAVNLNPVEVDKLPTCVRLHYQSQIAQVPPSSILQLPFLGVSISSDLITLIAEGLVDPSSKEEFEFCRRVVTHPDLVERQDGRKNHYQNSSHLKKSNSKNMKRSASDSATVVEKFRRISSKTLQPFPNLYRQKSTVPNYSSSSFLKENRPNSAPATILTDLDIPCHYEMLQGKEKDQLKYSHSDQPKDSASERTPFSSQAQVSRAFGESYIKDSFISPRSEFDTPTIDIYTISAELSTGLSPTPFSNPKGSRLSYISPSDSEYLDNFIASRDTVKEKTKNTPGNSKRTIKQYFTIQQATTQASLSKLSEMKKSQVSNDRPPEDSIFSTASDSESLYQHSLLPPSTTKSNIFEKFMFK